MDLLRLIAQKGAPAAAEAAIAALKESGVPERIGDLLVWQGESGQRVLASLEALRDSNDRISADDVVVGQRNPAERRVGRRPIDEGVLDASERDCEQHPAESWPGDRTLPVGRFVDLTACDEGCGRGNFAWGSRAAAVIRELAAFLERQQSREHEVMLRGFVRGSVGDFGGVVQDAADYGSQEQADMAAMRRRWDDVFEHQRSLVRAAVQRRLHIELP